MTNAQNANVNAENEVKTISLKHTSGKTVEFTTDMKMADIQAAFKATGFGIGPTSIREFKNAEKPVTKPIGGWFYAQAPKAEDTPADAPKADDVKVNDEPTPADAVAKKELTPEQAKLAADAEAEHGSDTKLRPGERIDPTTGKPTFRGADWKSILPQEPKPVKEGSMLHKLFVRLATKPATKQELMEEFGWSSGGLSGILHWEPKAKGYFLHSEKVDGVLKYSLRMIGGHPVTTVLTKAAPEPKAAKAPKAPKEPKAPKVEAAAAANASKAPKTPKSVSAVPPSAGNITKRVSKKKAAEAAAK